jgi:two-component sensor histidine kinase/PAS domain-containing protein
MRSPFVLETSLPHRFRWLFAGTLIVIAAILAAIALVLIETHRDALEDTETSLLRQSLSLSELTDRTFQAVDLMLVSVADKVHRDMSVDRGLQQLENRETREFLKEKVSELPQINALGILDTNGVKINSSRPWFNPGLNHSDRKYFQELKSDPQKQISISMPMRGETTHAWIIVVARPVWSETGEFRGAVYATIVLDYFEELFRATSFGDGYAATLLDPDGTLLARYPMVGQIGTAVSSPILAVLAGSRSGVSRTMGPVDQQPRITAGYKLTNFPLILVASQTEYAALNGWRSIVVTATAVALALIGIILIAAFLIGRSWGQQDQLTLAHAQIAEASSRQVLAEAEMDRQRDLATHSALFNAAVENMPQGLSMYDGSQRLIVCNERYRDMYSLTREQTKPGTTLRAGLKARAAMGNIPEDVDAYVERRMKKVRDGDPYYVEDKLRDGRIIGITHQLMPGGGWVAVHQDITDRKRAAEHQTQLVAELDHRVKNILARVAVVAKYTRQGSHSMDELIRALDGRIQSMADAHALLSQSRWRGVGLSDLVRRQLAPYTTKSNMVIDGPDVTLSAVATQAVAMVLQELVTNAVKYGALSTPRGKVSVSWNLRTCPSKPRLQLTWQEIGGPRVTVPKESSYGTNLIRNLVPHELGGTAKLEFAPEGAHCDIEIPLDQLLTNCTTSRARDDAEV